MKKISLKNLKLDVGDLLQREQLKSILGGNDDYSPNGNGSGCGGCGCHNGCTSPNSTCFVDSKQGACVTFTCDTNAVGLYCYVTA
tara:strand:- start:10576 stop:10830 length:255 start_codon:yes stop_codon:yes gene_type:complete